MGIEIALALEAAGWLPEFPLTGLRRDPDTWLRPRGAGTVDHAHPVRHCAARIRTNSCTEGYIFAQGEGAMPRKIRQLRAELKRAGLVRLKERGKGDHEVWEHPTMPGVQIVLDGKDGDDAKPYQERNVRNVLDIVRNAKE